MTEIAGKVNVMKHKEMAFLKQHLFDSYGGFSDKRIKNLDKSDLFIADDRVDTDFDSRGNLFHWFCMIFARVVGPDMVNVELRGGVPESALISEWADAGNAKTEASGLMLSTRITDVGGLRRLADLIDEIVRPGKRYEVPAYKYVCPRTSMSLRRLADVLENAPTMRGRSAV